MILLLGRVGEIRKEVKFFHIAKRRSTRQWRIWTEEDFGSMLYIHVLYVVDRRN